MKGVLRILSIMCIAFIAIACGGGGGETSIFSIPSGTQFPVGGGDVLLQNIPAGSTVFVTTDGEVPTEDDCEAFDISTPIPITVNRTVKVLIVTGGTAGAIQEANYTVEGASTDYTNEDMVYAWHAWEKDIRCEMNGCSEPSGTGDWNFTCPAGGSVNWHIALSGLAGDSTFTYNNCTYTSTDETTGITSTLTVNGFMHGLFGLDKSDDTDGNVTIAGDFNGYVEDHVQIRDATKTGGSYLTTCTDAGCASGDATYLVSWDGSANQFAYFEASGAGGDALSCAAPWYLLKQKDGGRCLQTVGGEWNVQSTSSCDVNDPSQQWELVPQGGNTVQLKNIDTGQCLSYEGRWVVIVYFEWSKAVACDTNDTKQNYVIEDYTQGGLDSTYPTRLRNGQLNNACLYTNNLSDVYQTELSCNLGGTENYRKWGIYVDGDFNGSPLRESDFPL